jgi:hypothetical protein
MSPYERGASLATQWTREQAGAGRTAEQVAATNAYVTGPLRERACRDAKTAETFQGWSTVVAVELERLREGQDARARQRSELDKQSATEIRGRPSLASNLEREEPMPESQGRSWPTQELAAAVQKVGAASHQEPEASPDGADRLSYAEAAAPQSQSPVPEHNYEADAEANAGGGEWTARDVPGWDNEPARSTELEPDFEPPF